MSEPVLLTEADLQKTISACSCVMDANVVVESVEVLYGRYDKLGGAGKFRRMT